jgi:microcin C transport system substrate-binding protein
MRILIVPILLLLHLFVPDTLQAAHGLSIEGTLKYPANFEKFEYASANAEKGGELILHDIGSFDKMNPFTLKGTPPFGLEQYVFEALAVPSLDEPFAQYGLIASDISVADDQLSVVFTINEHARFSDGQPITPEDVKFTIDTLKSDAVHPFYPNYYKDIDRAEILDERRVAFHFKQVNRELPMIAGQISVMSRSFYQKHGFDSDKIIIPVGSGPYTIASYNQGRSITYRRNPNYWAVSHPTRKGMYNFDKITVKYYKDQTVAVEAFKAGEFDSMQVNIAKQWVRDMAGPKFDNNLIIKKKFSHKNNAGLQGFVMNSRRSVFADRVVRKAVGMAFDFSWVNKSLFYGQYIRNNSYFSNSYLAAEGLPSDDELSLLVPFGDTLPEDVFTKPMGGDDSGQKGGIRAQLRDAAILLKDHGWTLQDGVLTNSDGVKLSFEIILSNQSFERVMAAFTESLKKIGVEARYRTIDPTLYADRINNFDFDMCVFVYGQSLSPGNEQRNFWHSESASQNGSRNLAGIKNKVVDYLVDKIIYADNQRQLTAACKALDRVLWYGYYLVPNWYADSHRVVYHNKFNIPDTVPKYYNYSQFQMTWWPRQNLDAVTETQ